MLLRIPAQHLCRKVAQAPATMKNDVRRQNYTRSNTLDENACLCSYASSNASQHTHTHLMLCCMMNLFYSMPYLPDVGLVMMTMHTSRRQVSSAVAACC